MNAFSRSRIVLPLASLMTVFALAAQAEEPNQQHKGPPPGAGRPPVQAARPSNPHPTGPAGPAAAHVSPGGPAAAHVPPGGPGGHARVVHGGPMPSRSFGGHPYRGHLAWEGGHWRHEMHNGRMGYWWDVGGAWYFYPQPMEGPPAYISDDYADDVGYGDVGPAAAYAPPPGAYPPPPPDPGASAIGGAIVGGVLGGLLTGRASGAAAGAVIGGATGAIAGASAASRPGYWMAEGNCYYRYPNGQYVQADPRWCY
jgi:hypothetical protein